MKKYFLLILCFWGLGPLNLAWTAPLPCVSEYDEWVEVNMHEFHLSKCNIVYDEQAQSFQITMHIFIDDLEEALRLEGHDQLFIATEKENAEAENHISNYLAKRFSLVHNQESLPVEFIGKEKTEDLAAIWCYLEVKTLPQLHELTITNNILLEVFDDQKNITNIQGPNNKTAYFMFQKGQSSDRVDFL